MRVFLFYLAILAVALAGGAYFAQALIEPAVQLIADLPDPPRSDAAKAARVSAGRIEEARVAPAEPAPAERPFIVAPAAPAVSAAAPVDGERARALRKAKEARKQAAKRPRRAPATTAEGQSRETLGFAPQRSFGPFTTDTSW
jgi:hypothetical protein